MTLGLLAAQVGAVSGFAEKIGLPLVVALIGLAGTLGVAALSVAGRGLSEAAARRREGYAEATRELVAWAEYPYCIRRRISDDPQVLADLAELGHRHQEALRYRATWIRAESGWVADIFEHVRRDISAKVGPACNDAWSEQPIASAADMSLSGWGPQAADEPLRGFDAAVSYRFGWRRAPALFGWRPAASVR